MGFKETYGLNVAVIGASNDRQRYSNKAVRAYAAEGYNVFPINPKEKDIEGIKAYPSVLDVPEKIDFASIYLNPESALRAGIPEQLRDKKVKMAILNPGSENDEMMQKLESYNIEFQVICSIAALGQSPEMP